MKFRQETSINGRHITTKKSTYLLPLLVLCLSILMFTIFQNDIASGQTYSKEVVVQAGDTLWSLSKTHAPERTDVRDYLSRIIVLNDLNGSTIYPGQILSMP